MSLPRAALETGKARDRHGREGSYCLAQSLPPRVVPSPARSKLSITGYDPTITQHPQTEVRLSGKVTYGAALSPYRGIVGPGGSLQDPSGGRKDEPSAARKPCPFDAVARPWC